jgi:protein-S-isoprenylcysteine O-methyltransferase Ste14
LVSLANTRVSGAERFRTLAADLLPRALLIAFYGYFGARTGIDALTRLSGSVAQGWFSEAALQVYPALGKSAFMLAIAVIAATRMRRVAGDMRIYARIVAFAGTFFLLLLPWIETRAVLPESIAVASSALILIGSVTSALVVTRLGQSFSIMPEARRLVVSGPYRFVRHPLYVAEELMMLGILIQYPLVWTIALVICHGLLQLERMRLEERILTSTFPEYAEYAARTARLIPGIY